MADVKVQAPEPDPSATSLPNDQSTNDQLGGQAVEAAKEPTETAAEELSKAQDTKNDEDIGKQEATGKLIHCGI